MSADRQLILSTASTILNAVGGSLVYYGKHSIVPNAEVLRVAGAALVEASARLDNIVDKERRP